MERIMVIGCCGCGKTTFSRQLAARLDLPLVHLDCLGWQGEWQAVPKETFDRLLQEEVEKPRWVIDGNYNRTIPVRLHRCDTVLFMDYPRRVCMWGVIRRLLQNYGKHRSDMGGTCRERLDLPFLRFVWNFRATHTERYCAMLRQQTDKRVVILKSRREAAAFLEQLGA